jgi:hypothetical protein
MRLPLYAEQLGFLAAVTRMLDTSKLPDVPDAEHFYLRVELRARADDAVVGYWSGGVAKECREI